jgi:prolyl-tRNA editing enzyme YbaK/EbsC (Cys-tRNA(Pro) deacylase)
MDRIETKATRLLDDHGVAYRLLPHTTQVFTVAEAAAQRGVVAEEMVKSILLRESKGGRHVMACVLGPDRLDYRAVRDVLGEGWSRLTFAGDAEITAVTGYPKGAVNPLCLPDDVPIIFDEAIARCAKVNISTGDLMAGLEMPAADLVRLAGARLAAIVVREEPGSQDAAAPG